MSEETIIITDDISVEMRDVLAGGLDTFNDGVVGYGDRRPLGVFVKDPDSAGILGGAVGRSSLGLLFLDLFYLPKSLRGRGLGSIVLHAFEAEGAARGCTSAVLYTISFQAPGFYERHNWRRFGEIPCDPPGTSRIFLTKRLRAPAGKETLSAGPPLPNPLPEAR